MQKFAIAGLATAVSASSDSHFKFMQYLAQHSKNYASVEEYNMRMNIWQKTEDFIVENNSSDSTHVAGHNYLSDWTAAERQSLLGLKNMPVAEPMNIKVRAPATSGSVDWNTAGAVTAVKDQGGCGSCWSFSATGGLEGAYQIAGNSLTSFSEQQLVECAGYAYGNMACYGGWYYQAWDYLKTNLAETEADYPYTSGLTGTWGSCAYDASEGVVNVASYAAVTPNDLDAMYAAIEQQPVSVAIEADTTVFQSYTSGVITSTACGTSLDHAVLAVGYGTDSSGVAYFLVKNSWAASWGEEGYVKIGAVEGEGICGINMNSYTVAV